MAWTSPRTWVSGEVPSAATWNTHVRDNFKAIGDPWIAWTPTITASSGTFTTTSATGRYISVGKLTIWSTTITLTTIGTAAGYVQFTLPVTAQAATGAIGSGTTSVGAASLMTQVFLNSATVGRAVRYDDVSVIAAGNVLRLSGAYEAA